MVQRVIRAKFGIYVKKNQTLLQIWPQLFLLFLFIALSVIWTGAFLLLVTAQSGDNLAEGIFGCEGCTLLLFTVVGSGPRSRMDGTFSACSLQYFLCEKHLQRFFSRNKQTKNKKKPNNCVAEASNLFQKKKNPTGSFIYESSISTRYARTSSRERRSSGTRQMSRRAEARWWEPSRRNEAIGTAEREGPLIRRRWSTRRGRSLAC